MNLMKDEKVLTSYGDNYITLTNYRIRQEIKSWGQINLKSIMLEQITSCEYRKRSSPLFLIIGLLIIGVAIFFLNETEFSIGFFSIGFILIILYFFSLKRGLYISSASGKIIINTTGMKNNEVKNIIEVLESAKNDRFLYKKESV